MVQRWWQNYFHCKNTIHTPKFNTTHKKLRELLREPGEPCDCVKTSLGTRGGGLKATGIMCDNFFLT